MPDPAPAPRSPDSQAEADLALIRRLMEGARQSTWFNSSHLIVWGSVLATAEAVTHLVEVGVVTLSLNLVWGVAVGIGVALSSLLGRRAWLRAPVNSLVNRMLAAIWGGAAIGLIIVGFLGDAAPGITAALFGSAFFASSFLPGKAIYLLLAAAWWILSGALLIWPVPESRLVISAALILFAAVPGLLIRIRNATPAKSRVIA